MTHRLVAARALAATLVGTARADLPFPLPVRPGPDLGQGPQGTGACARSVQRHAAALARAPIGRLRFPRSGLIRCNDTV